MSTNGGPREVVLNARRELAAGREKLADRLRDGVPGVQVSRSLSSLYDKICLNLFHQALEDLGETGENGIASQVTLIADGGFGRNEVAPYSDADMNLLHTPAVEGRLTALSQRLIQDFCDVGLASGIVCHTVFSACSSALEDIRSCSSLLDARPLDGDESLYLQFLNRFQAFTRRRRRTLIDLLIDARQQECTRYGETVYLLQPNVKRSPGALRDIQLLRWIGRLRYGTGDLDGLRLQGHLPLTDYQNIRAALQFLLWIRNALHFNAGRGNDNLTHDCQVRLASEYGYEQNSGMLPAEHLMQEYFRHTDEMSRLLARFSETAIGLRRRPKWVQLLIGHRLDGDFREGRGLITSTRRGTARVTSRLEEAVDLFNLASLTNARVDHDTCEAIRLAVPSMDNELTPRAREKFLSLLGRRQRLGALLRSMHEIGLLEQVIPEFEHARSLMQFNDVHKYTVDEHSIRAVEGAVYFATVDETNYDIPADVDVGQACREIERVWLLHLALLIHDLGKGYDEDHCVVGERLAEDVAGRLQLSESDTDVLKFLVRHHLRMSYIAMNLDIHDEKLLKDFVAEVGSAEVMKLLFVLTASDFSAVGPRSWNNWRAGMLSNLYNNAMPYFTGESSPASVGQLRRKREKAISLLPDAERPQLDWHSTQVNSLSDSYVVNHEPQTIVDLLVQLKHLSPDELQVEGHFDEHSQTVRYSVATNESLTTGAFHRMAGALTASGMEILSAEINTLADGQIYDRYMVVDPQYPKGPPEWRITKVCEAIRTALLTTQGDSPTFQRFWQDQKSDTFARLAGVKTAVKLDNETSDNYTVIEIRTSDANGLLFTITRTIFDLELSVVIAKITTGTKGIVDTFYVTDAQNEKIVEDGRLQEIRDRLISEIDEFRPH